MEQLAAVLMLIVILAIAGLVLFGLLREFMRSHPSRRAVMNRVARRYRLEICRHRISSDTQIIADVPLLLTTLRGVYGGKALIVEDFFVYNGSLGLTEPFPYSLLQIKTLLYHPALIDYSPGPFLTKVTLGEQSEVVRATSFFSHPTYEQIVETIEMLAKK